MLTGVNREIIDRIGDHDLLESCSLDDLKNALSAHDSNLRRDTTIDVVSRIWRSIPGLGVPPLLEELKSAEDTNGIYKGYRDHVVHTLQVFLLGLDMLENLPELRDKIEQKGQIDNIGRAWAVASLGHDHGYFLSVVKNKEIPEALRKLLNNPLTGLGYSSGKIEAFNNIHRSFSAGATMYIDSLLKLHVSNNKTINLIDIIEKGIPPNFLGPAEKQIETYRRFYQEEIYIGSADHGIGSALIILQLYHRLVYFLESVSWNKCTGENSIFEEWDIRKELQNAEKDVHAGCRAIALHNVWTELPEEQIKLAEASYHLDLKNYRLTLEETPLAWLLAFCDTLQGWNRQQPNASKGEITRYSTEPENISITYHNDFMYFTFLDKEKILDENGVGPFWSLQKNLKGYLNSEDYTFLQEGPYNPKKVEKQSSSILRTTKKNFRNMGKLWTQTFSKKDFEFRYEASKRNFIYDVKPICVLYTGGSVGMIPEDPDDEDSPLITAPLDKMLPYLTKLYRLKFDIHFFETPTALDSSNIGLQDWQEIGQLVMNLYSYYQGFVILHGTDTMTYTASALSFMFDNLNKPIIFTGAERPLCLPQSDAESNIMRALQIAAPTSIEMRVVPEVCILFGTRLLRANRTKKTHALDFNGFDSPNYHHLGRIEDKVEIYEHYIRRNKKQNVKVEFNRNLEPGVAIFEIYPNLDGTNGGEESTVIEFFRYILLNENSRIKGLILKTYGTGNAPSMPAVFLEIIQEAIQKKGKVIVNLSHCLTGEVEVRLFETNVRLFELGVINGGDMTVEAAYTKLMSLLNTYPKVERNEDGGIEYGFDVDTIKSEFQIDQRGELRYSARSIVYPEKTNEIIKIENGMFLGWSLRIDMPDDANVTKAYIRITNLKLMIDDSQKGKEFFLSFFINATEFKDKLFDEEAEKFKVKTISRVHTGEPITFNLDATKKVKDLLIGKTFGSLQIKCKDNIAATVGTYELAIFTEENTY